ncbi:hypothetical protein [Microbacterium sp. YY-01]|uniref:hypothetical protein n=1 Tax=Microbacterium sp. YY-01 TaxID=3421634 RepID=UPI003D17FBFC
MIRTRRLVVSVAVFALTGVFGMAGCAATATAESEPTISFTPVPEDHPTARPGAAEPLATDSTYGIDLTIFEELRYPAEDGCGCKLGITEDEPERYPAGTDVIMLRLVFTATKHVWNDTDFVILPEIGLSPVFLDGAHLNAEPYADAPVVIPSDAQRVAQERGLTLLDNADLPEEIPIGESRTYAVAYYVPYGASVLDLRMSNYVDDRYIKNWDPNFESNIYVEFSPSDYYVRPSS